MLREIDTATVRPNIEARWTGQGAGFWLRRIAAGEHE